VLGAGAVGALSFVDWVPDAVVVPDCTEASGADFLMSLCGLRIGARSFEVERLFVVVLFESWAFSCPSATNCSATAETEVKHARATANAVGAVSACTCPVKRRRDSKCCMTAPL